MTICEEIRRILFGEQVCRCLRCRYYEPREGMCDECKHPERDIEKNWANHCYHVMQGEPCSEFAPKEKS